MSQPFSAPPKDPSAVLTHAMDWTAWLDAGETITAETVTSSAPAVLVIDQVAEAGGVISWRVAGGLARVTYIVTVSVTTSAGRIDQRSVAYRVRER
jgi:hypothetical protein